MNKITNNETDGKLNKLLVLCMVIFASGTFMLETFLFSLQTKMIYIIVTIILLLIYYILENRRLSIYILELMWFLFFMYFFINMIINGEIEGLFIYDIIAFATLFIIVLLLKVDAKYFNIAINIMLIFAVIHALVAIFQFVNMELYSKLILTRFTEKQKIEILRIFNHNSYTGLTRQTAYISGFLVIGIGIALINFRNYKNHFRRNLVIFSLPLMMFALLLGGKRAHLLFMVLSFMIVYLFSTNIKRFLVQLLKLIGIMFISIFLIILFHLFYQPDSNSPIGKMYIKLENTVEGFLVGEDITSGRTILYDYALKLFYDNPVFGIGWRKFNDLTFGLLSDNTGSHPHNIYLQLLTELGIIGFILFMLPVVYLLILTIKLLMKNNNETELNNVWRRLIQISLFIQTFFILYGFTGNLLTDHMYIFIYVFSATITMSYLNSLNKKIKNEDGSH